MSTFTCATVVLLVVWGAFAQPAPCGDPPIKPDENRIVGGHDAKPYSWPWQIGFFRHGFLSTSLMCGGSLIAPQWVMSAGHCAYGNTDNPGHFLIKLGDFNQHSNSEDGEIEAEIEEMFVHPDYDPQTVKYDVSLLKLKEPVTYTDHIQPVCLPKSDGHVIESDKIGFVTGWGTLHSGGLTLPANLQQVQVPFVNQSNCDQDYTNEIFDGTMFCAGQKGKDSCQGDSGGPLVHKDPTSNIWYEYGIVSWGQGCALQNYPGVYSRVSAYCDWIAQTVGQEICKPVG